MEIQRDCMACWSNYVLEPRLEIIYRGSLPAYGVRIAAPQEYNIVQGLGRLKDYLPSPTAYYFFNR